MLVQCIVRKDIEQQSDHFPIATILQLQTAKQEAVPRRVWKKLDTRALAQALKESRVFEPDQNLRTKAELDSKVAQIHKAYQQAIDKAVPWAKPSQFAESFWTPECTEAVHYARQLRRTRPDSQEYREAVKHKRKVVRTAKTLSFRTKIHEATEDTKGIWRLAKWARTRGHILVPIP